MSCMRQKEVPDVPSCKLLHRCSWRMQFDLGVRSGSKASRLRSAGKSHSTLRSQPIAAQSSSLLLAPRFGAIMQTGVLQRQQASQGLQRAAQQQRGLRSAVMVRAAAAP